MPADSDGFIACRANRQVCRFIRFRRGVWGTEANGRPAQKIMPKTGLTVGMYASTPLNVADRPSVEMNPEHRSVSQCVGATSDWEYSRVTSKSPLQARRNPDGVIFPSRDEALMGSSQQYFVTFVYDGDISAISAQISFHRVGPG